MGSKKLLVPHDFTTVAETAVEHAVKVAETINGSVCLLHVVAKDSEINAAEVKLQAEADKISASHNVEISYIVRVGNIFEDIGDAAAENHAQLIFMGTHGAKGWQHVTGSHAMKVVTNSSVPFVVVQQKGIKDNGYDDIVVPLDLHKETKQKLAIVGDMAQYFDSRVHLITPKESDEYLHNKLNANIAFAKKYLGEKGIAVTATTAESGGFVKRISEYAKEIDADLISIMNLQANSLMGIIGSSYEQGLITNDAQIPVMILNPQQTTVSSGSVLFS
jgi:nucleotide-binding universal stress UspA family protein